MNAAMASSAKRHIVGVDGADDFEGWRAKARSLAAGGVAPDRVHWSCSAQGAFDLFGAGTAAPDPLPPAMRPVRANKAFLDLAQSVILHRDPARFALAYQLLWRLQAEGSLMERAADPLVHRLTLMARQVRRDIHKMRAFLRFRLAHDGDGGDRFVAWFEPDHHIVRANARFFLDRFASQRWSILTPALCIHWDGETLTESPGADRDEAPREDGMEALWQRYYASIFNPARLKVATMVKEMPRRYWKNMPEARLIPGLIAGAQKREAAMVALGSAPPLRAPPASLRDIADGVALCRACPIGCNGTRPVAGEGPADARLLIVGEQPGDCEEREGRAFIGPAGQVLDQHLAAAGLDRSRAWVTNAVKHFKFEQRGKRRIHQGPTAGEIDHCRWWLDAERRLIRPDVILALGASAGRAVLGRTPSIASERGRMTHLPDGGRLWLTVHPSFLLRLQGPAREAEQQKFGKDLAALAALLQARPATRRPPLI